MKNSVIDAFDLMMPDGKDDEARRKSIDDALIDSLNKFGAVNISYIAETADVTVEEAVKQLDGIIFQKPEIMGEEYDITKGWVVSANYLSGNAELKLETAYRINRKFPGKFDKNIEALKKILPVSLNIDEIHISLGASWIPVEEYMFFISDFLNLKEAVKVVYYKELARYKVVPTDEAGKSVLNTITYGVRGDEKSSSKSGWVKQYLTALDIIEDTLNAKTVKVYDYIPTHVNRWNYFEYEAVFNRDKTIEAQDKQRQIIDAFKDWVYKNKYRIRLFEKYYNDTFVGYTYSKYNGDFLRLPELNPEIKLYKHQRDAIARVLLSGTNTLFSHDVGTGKTYEMIVSVHELWRMKLSEKNLIVVPNNVLKAMVDAHRLLYKDDEILVIYPKDFIPDKRNTMLKKIRDGSYVAIYMAYSSFDMITMSKEYYVDKLKRELNALKAAAYNAKEKYIANEYTKQAKAVSKKLAKYEAEQKDSEYITFEELGINTLVVDEAHNYKNVPISSRADNIVGMSNGGSKKCREMLEKAHFVDRLIFATGTPLTNSLADLFTFQLYLQPDVLEYYNINTFDTWVNTFGRRETSIECDVDANSTSLRTMTRFASFHNLGELMALFSQVCDFHHLAAAEEGLPKFGGAIDICVPKNEAQSAYIKGLSERTELIRNREVKRSEDNLLKVTTDGRKAALDIRLTDCKIPLGIHTKTKIAVCADKVFELYNKYPSTAQIVFSDIGTPKTDFNVYDCLAQHLIQLGIPREEIAYVHDATSESARAKLFAEMNSGKLRVVIGSTQKLGVGVNVQERLIALHHLSVPWRPADMVQREGRIIRKGNTCEQVFIFRYITEGSFDAYSWQLLENKQRFISSFLSGNCAEREMDDIADAVLTYAEVKALCIGNKLIKTRVEVANQLERAKVASRARQRQMQELRTVIETSPKKQEQLKTLAKIARKDFAFYSSLKTAIPNDERIAFGEELIEALKENIAQSTQRIFDDYRGFDIVLPADMSEDCPYILIKSINNGCYRCEIELDKSALGCSKTIDYLLEHLDSRAQKLCSQADEVKKQMIEAQIDLDKDNPYIELIEELKIKLDDIDLLLEEGKQEKKVC